MPTKQKGWQGKLYGRLRTNELWVRKQLDCYFSPNWAQSVLCTRTGNVFGMISEQQNRFVAALQVGVLGKPPLLWVIKQGWQLRFGRDKQPSKRRYDLLCICMLSTLAGNVQTMCCIWSSQSLKNWSCKTCKALNFRSFLSLRLNKQPLFWESHRQDVRYSCDRVGRALTDHKKQAIFGSTDVLLMGRKDAAFTASLLRFRGRSRINSAISGTRVWYRGSYCRKSNDRVRRSILYRRSFLTRRKSKNTRRIWPSPQTQ